MSTVTKVATTSATPRVLILSQFYWPEEAMYERDIADHLSTAAGAHVQVVTGYPNRPGGRIYSSYHQTFRSKEYWRGIGINRVPLVINHSANPLERFANFASFALSAMTSLRLAKGADVVYVYATPMTAALPAQVWKFLFGTPYVLHVQDVWPESVTGSGMLPRSLNSFITKALTPWLTSAYKNAAHVLAISPGMKPLLASRGASEETTTVVYNWARESNIITTTGRESTEGNLVLAYAGNLGRMQDLGTVVEAVRSASESLEIELRIAGDGVEEESLRRLASDSPNIKFLGLIDPLEIHELYRESDFQLVTLLDMPIFRVTIPSKLQASLASGVPVITTVQGDVARVVQEYEAGLVADPEDANSLADALARAAATTAAERRRMSRNAKRLYEDLMSKRVGLNVIAGVLLEHAEHKAAHRTRRRLGEPGWLSHTGGGLATGSINRD
ncbi:glycosyltransferase family 4 protein [uncultured Brachybacterium sp.]|uniref:glycosyltransferase family 4 protein n=1 Tax=uncultured Brachybacterium sp. TaxID=189680 RepID=UPI00260CD79C|nr:glycosyltransferase family 4 protein [uncultured Brachybacterium sp.]